MKMTRKRLVFLTGMIVLCGAAIAGVALIRHGFSARENPSWIETVLARTARRMAVPAKAKQMTNPVPSTAENLTEGRAHWAGHCAMCHANNGGGDTVIGKNLYPKAPDMRLLATQNVSDGELYYTIENGIRLTGMPAWGERETTMKTPGGWCTSYGICRGLLLKEEKEMEHLNPKGPEERKEEQEEQEFLNQSPTPPERPHHKTH